MNTALIVDDQPHVRLLVREYLAHEGFAIIEAENGQQALMVARQQQPTIILLDLMMPEMDGITFLQTYRQESATPIIVLSARDSEADTVTALELGADDYINKPFSMRAVTAHIFAVLRRSNVQRSANEVLRADTLCLDHRSHRVTLAGKEVGLTPSEFKLLATLMAAPGRAFTRAQLQEQLQGFDAETVERTMDVHIRNLRGKIENDMKRPHFIETIHGIGYRFREQTGHS